MAFADDLEVSRSAPAHLQDKMKPGSYSPTERIASTTLHIVAGEHPFMFLLLSLHPARAENLGGMPKAFPIVYGNPGEFSAQSGKRKLVHVLCGFDCEQLFALHGADVEATDVPVREDKVHPAVFQVVVVLATVGLGNTDLVQGMNVVGWQTAMNSLAGDIAGHGGGKESSVFQIEKRTVCGGYGSGQMLGIRRKRASIYAF